MRAHFDNVKLNQSALPASPGGDPYPYRPLAAARPIAAGGNGR